MQIADDTVVSFAYRLQNADGDVLDESTTESPLTYLHGHDGLIPGMENALAGKAAGDEFECEIPPDEAYGSYDPELDLAVPLDAFAEADREQLAPGVRFEGPHPKDDSQPLVYTIHEVDDDSVKVSGNHPLAGMTLHFQVNVVDVRPATEEEISHGHAHGPGGHQH